MFSKDDDITPETVVVMDTMAPVTKTHGRAKSFGHGRSDSNVRFLMDTNKNLLLENEEFKKELFKLSNEKTNMTKELKSTHKFYSELVDIPDLSEEDDDDDIEKVLKQNQDLKAQNKILLRQQQMGDKEALEMQSKMEEMNYKLHNLKQFQNQIVQLKSEVTQLSEIKDDCDDEIHIKSQELQAEKVTVERLRKQMDEYLENMELAFKNNFNHSIGGGDDSPGNEGRDDTRHKLEEAKSKITTLQQTCERQNEQLLNMRTDYDLLEKDRNRWIRKCDMLESKANCNFFNNMFQ